MATDKVAGKLSSTLSWVKNSVSHTVSQMASQVATPSSLHTTVASSTASLSSPSSASPSQLSPDDVELLAKLEEQNRYECLTQCHRDDFCIFSVYQSTTLLTIFPLPEAFWEHCFVGTLQCLLGINTVYLGCVRNIDTLMYRHIFLADMDMNTDTEEDSVAHAQTCWLRLIWIQEQHL